MAKASHPGRTKTRLVPPLDREQAAEINTAFLRDIATNLLAAGEQTPVSPWMAIAPAGSQAFFRSILPAEIGLVEAVASNFGDCLDHAMTSLLGMGFRSACLINSDSPTLPTPYLVTAATALAAEGDRVVLGPSTDGGYYLIGLKTPQRRMFEDIAWSTDVVFEQTMARAAEIGLPVVVLPSWYDVDEAEALATLAGELLDARPFRAVARSPLQCEHSRRLLQALLRAPALARRLGRRATIDEAAETRVA